MTRRPTTPRPLALPARALGAAGVAALLAVAAGCGRAGSAAPWLTMPTPTTHAAYFPIGPADPHGQATVLPLLPAGSDYCNGCHSVNVGGVFQPAPSFTQFTCTGCHVPVVPGVFHDDPVALGQLHAGVPGFAFTDAACYGCHRSGIGVDHAPIFPLPHGDATGIAACADCHVDPTDRTVLGCAGCHPHDLTTMATAHAAVGGYQFTSALCARCHGDSTVPTTVAAHAFPIAPGVRHSGTPDGACLTCHPGSRPAPKAFAADFSTFDCLACHAQADTTSSHSGVSGFSYASSACYGCHPTGSGGG